ncbi:MAG: hypothetical protein ABUL72_06080, partial [Armatimonadota bacterium]
HVEGEGYLRLMNEGRQVFTKSCTLVVSGGRLQAADGPALLPTIPVPGEPQSITVGLDGTVTGLYVTGKRSLGRLILADFPADVRPVASGNYYLCYGKPDLGNPGEGNYGVVQMDKKPDETVTIKAPSTAKISPVPLTPTPNAVELTLKTTSTIDSESVTLGDVVDGLSPDLASLDLGVTPPVGIERHVSRQQITDRLRRAGYKQDQVRFGGAAQTTVSRAGQQVNHEDFVQAACTKAKEELNAEAIATGPSAPSMTVPKGKVELIPESSQVSGSTDRVTIAVYVDGKRFNSRVISCRVNAAVQAPNQKVSTGQQVDVVLKKGGLTVQTKGVVRRFDQASGQVTVEVEPSKAQVTGKLNAKGEVEVTA